MTYSFEMMENYQIVLKIVMQVENFDIFIRDRSS